jgi:hypothetical protein
VETNKKGFLFISFIYLSGLLPDGGVWLECSEEERMGARDCWLDRQRELLTTLLNVAISAAEEKLNYCLFIRSAA